MGRASIPPGIDVLTRRRWPSFAAAGRHGGSGAQPAADDVVRPASYPRPQAGRGPADRRVTHGESRPSTPRSPSLKRDLAVFRSYRLRFPAQALTGFASVAVIYYISRLVSVQPFENPDQYFAFAVVGLVIVEILFSTMRQCSGSRPAGVGRRNVREVRGLAVRSCGGRRLLARLPLLAGIRERDGNDRVCSARIRDAPGVVDSRATPFRLRSSAASAFAPFALLAGAARDLRQAGPERGWLRDDGDRLHRRLSLPRGLAHRAGSSGRRMSSRSRRSSSSCAASWSGLRSRETPGWLY